MPECLDYMPWSSVYGLRTMAPAILHVGDYKNDKLKDGTPVQFRLIGLNHDVTKSGLVVPMTWEMVDCMPNRYPWERESGNYGPWPTTDLRRRMNDPNGDIYKLMPDLILEFAVPVLKLSVDVAEGEDKLVESEDKFFIKSEVEMFGRAIYSAPGEGHWYEWYRQENVPWYKIDPQNGKHNLYHDEMRGSIAAVVFAEIGDGAVIRYTPEYDNRPHYVTTSTVKSVEEDEGSLVIETNNTIYTFQVVKQADFTSVWDGGVAVTTNCKVNIPRHKTTPGRHPVCLFEMSLDVQLCASSVQSGRRG